MYPANFNYHRATSFREASELLTRFGDDSKAIAGGQTLLPLLKLRLVTPQHLVDIGRIKDASAIERDGARLRIGALATHADIAAAQATRAFPMVAECSGGIADPQVRNRGTIGGSLAEADPSSCWPALLFTLDARVECISSEGTRWQLIRELLREPYAPALKKGELIQHVEIDLPGPNTHGSFVAFKRCAQAYPTASCAVLLTLDSDRCREVRIGFGCLGLTPLVAPAAEQFLRGARLTDETIRSVATLAASATEPLADGRGSVEYKRFLAAGLVRRAIANAMARAQGRATSESHTYYGR
jgi:carbon-monoxide dehydrogenase medium subunit